MLALFPVLPPSIQSLSLVFFSVSTLLLHYRKFKKSIQDKNKWVLYFVVSSFYIFAFLSYFWTSNKVQFWREVQPSISIIILPFLFVFLVNKLDEKIFQLIKSLFILSFLAYILFLWFPNFINGIEYYYNHILNEPSVFGNSNYIEKIVVVLRLKIGAINGITPDYMSNLGLIQSNYNLIFMHHTFIGSIGVFVLLLIFDYKIKWYIKTFGILILLVFMYLNESKINTVLLLTLIPYFIVSKRSFKFQRIIYSLFSLSCIVLIYKYWGHIELFQKKFNINDAKFVVDYVRYLIYQSCIEISKDNLVYGVGLGDIIPMLNEKLNSPENAFIFGYNPQFNSHSDYLKFLLAGGIFNLFLFFGSIAYLFYISIKKSQNLVVCFLVIIFVNGLFECYLSRFWGALFYSFFISIFLNRSFIDESTK